MGTIKNPGYVELEDEGINPIRPFAQNIGQSIANQKFATNTNSATGADNISIYICPKNKRAFINSVQILAINQNGTASAWTASLEINQTYNFLSLRFSGNITSEQSETLNFAYPIVLNSGDEITLSKSDSVLGSQWMRANVTLWEEDITGR